MIGTTFRLGFDGTSVSRGLGNLTRGLGRGFGKIATGAMERVGHRMTDLMGRIVMAVPEAIKDTADWAGSLTDMSTATGMSIEELVLLEEKFRLAGVSAKESGAVVSRFAMNLKEAATEGGPAAEALRKLGFDGQFGVGKKPGEAFEIIAKRIAAVGGSLGNVEGVMADLFGAKLGYQQLKLFNDFAAVTAQAENNVGKLAKVMGKGAAQDLDRWGDALGRFENFKRSLVTIGMQEFMRFTGGAGGPDRMFNFLDPEKVRPKIQEIFNTLGRNLEVFLSQGFSQSFGDIFRNIGKELGEGIKESFKGTITGKGLFKGLFSSTTPTAGTQENPALPELRRHTTLLQQIRDESTTARFV